jgi:hypothetical protein
MIVHSLFSYLADAGAFTWHPDDWTANRIIRAVHGLPFDGHFELQIAGKRHRFDRSNVATFLPTIYNVVAAKMAATIPGTFAIIPIPSSTSVIGSADEFSTLVAARMIARRLGHRAEAVAGLVWKTPKIPAREGGNRDPQQHFENLQVSEKPTQPIVLYDHVMRTGSQMIAAYRRLLKDATAPVAGFVLGRTVRFQREKVIGWTAEDFPVVDEPINIDELFGWT